MRTLLINLLLLLLGGGYLQFVDQTKLVLNRISVIESLVPNRTNTMGGQHQYSTGSGLLAPISNNSTSYDFLPTVSLTVPPTN